MNSEELKNKLEELNVPGRYYSINSSISSDRYVFRQVHIYWECFYIDERGGQNDYHRFDNENDACDYFVEKVKKQPNQEFYEFNLSFIPEKKTKEKLEIYRVRHAECRTKWFESLLKLYKHFVKGEPLPPINKNKLIFIDDQVGINQEIKQDTIKVKKQVSSKNSVFLRNFKILSELGVGAFGTVFKVQHILTEKIYAMKVMNKNYIIQKKYLHY